MKISVIVPVFNRPALILRALNSILEQTHRPYEMIVVDDGSTDNTYSVLEAYQRSLDLKEFSLHVLRLDRNHGVSFARNRGIQRATGDWIALLDSDDQWLPKRLELQVELLEREPHLQLVHGEEIWIRSGVRVNPHKKHLKEGGRIFSRSTELCLISPSAVLLRKSLWKEMGGFDETFPVCEDYDLWLKVTSLYEVGFVSQPIIMKYGGHTDQLSRRTVAMDYWRVRSLNRILEIRNLGPDEERVVLGVIIQKSQILCRGYKKHDNRAHLSEVEEILTRALNRQYFLNQR